MQWAGIQPPQTQALWGASKFQLIGNTELEAHMELWTICTWNEFGDIWRKANHKKTVLEFYKNVADISICSVFLHCFAVVFFVWLFFFSLQIWAFWIQVFPIRPCYFGFEGNNMSNESMRKNDLENARKGTAEEIAIWVQDFDVKCLQPHKTASTNIFHLN